MAKTATALAPVPASSLEASDPMAVMLASLVPADLSLFEKTKKAPKSNAWLPFVKKSIEGKNADGEGAPFQFPQPYGESGAVTAAIRRAGRELGVTVQARWQPVDAEKWTVVLKACDTTPEDSDAGKANRKVRDDFPGFLAFRTVPQVTRNKSGEPGSPANIVN